MPNTSRMGWPYPNEHDDPWYATFQSLMAAQDASGYAAREDRNLLLHGGGTFSFVASTSTLSWTEKIQILSPTVGFSTEVAVGSITVNDGEMVYLDVVRNPTGSVTVSLAVASKIPSSDSAYLVAVRIGSTILFRGGAVIQDGLPSNPIGTQLLLGVGQTLRHQIAVATGATTNQTAALVVGGGYINPSKYQMTYTSPSLKFAAIGNVTGIPLTGTVQLYNVTDAAVEATLTFTGVNPSKAISSALTFPSAEKLYEVRAFTDLAGGDSLVLAWAGFELDLVRLI